VERVLVCILASTRAHEVAWPSFKRQVLDELNADLALAITFNAKYDYANPYWQHARYKWTAPESDDVADAFDLAQDWLYDEQDVAPPEWRSMLRIKGIWQDGIRSAEKTAKRTSRSAHSAFFCRWLLLHGLKQDGILDCYDRFVVTRSDFVWLSPHPPLSVLDRDSLWIPDGEHYGGLTDRHLIVSREHAAIALGVMEDILLRPDELYEEMKDQPSWNPEQFLAHHYARKGLLQRVKLFPYVMYLARGARDTGMTWSEGRYEPSVGHVVKYGPEFRRATANATVIKTRKDWQVGAWRTLDPGLASVPFRPSALERFALWPGRKIFWGLIRPGRVARFGRFYRRTLQRFRPPANPAGK
jgi:hypothetical protein